MIKILAYTPEHLEKIKLKECHKNEISDGTTLRKEAITFTKDDEPIAIFGGYFVINGVYQLWGLVGEAVKQCPLSFAKSAKLFLEYQIERLSIRRVQLSVRCDCPEIWKWAVFLGFKCEGIMRAYGPDGSDYWLFARVAT